MIKFARKGLHLPKFEYRSLFNTQIKRVLPPRFITLSLLQQENLLAVPLVEKGDRVFVGMKVAEGIVPIHSSVSGYAAEVETQAIRIESDESNTLDASVQSRQRVPIDSDELIAIVREAGIIGLGRHNYPAYLHLMEARLQGVRTIVLDGCTSDPFITSDYALMINHPVEILKGAELIRLASGAERVVIVVDEKRIEALEVLNSRNYNLRMEAIETLAVPSFYPGDEERMLAEAICARSLGRNEKLSSVKIAVENVATAYAIYEAVFLGKPLYERVVTVEGACVTEPKNLWVPLGASVRDVLRASKGLLRDPGRLILGGPMRGEAVASLDQPVAKSTRAVLSLPKDSFDLRDEEPCIRCGFCASACPEELSPEMIVRSVRSENLELAREFGIDACTECGNCAYVCPSKISIVEVIQKGKSVLLAPNQQASFPEPSYVVSAQAER
jgi:electron transport complex protein RnfC